MKGDRGDGRRVVLGAAPLGGGRGRWLVIVKVHLLRWDEIIIRTADRPKAECNVEEVRGS